MKDILFILFLLTAQFSLAQDDCVKQYKIDSVDIVYFCKDFNYESDPLRYIKRRAGLKFKDTIQFVEIDFDIIRQIECDLPIQLVELNKSREFRKGCPNIETHLSKYIRQYYSYKDKDNEHIIYIYFIWRDFNHNDYYDIRKPLLFDDGCSHFWNIKYNTKTKKFFDLQINGSA